MQIRILSPASHSHWNQCLAQLPGANVFHTSNWAQVLAGSYNYRPLYITAFEDEKITGCIPMMDVESFLTGRRGVSLPFTDECPLLADSESTFGLLWENAYRYSRKLRWKYIELRGTHAAIEGEPAHAAYFTHSLNVGMPEKQIWAKFRASTKGNIRKAVRKGVEVRELRSLDAIKAFYGLNCLTRQKHGLPPQPFSFFSKVHHFMISKGLGFVLLAFYQDRVIAGAVFLCHSGKLFYKYGASNLRYQHLRANNLILWEAIKWANRNGYRRFDLGRTEPSHSGLLQFKHGWGAEEKALHYFRFYSQLEQFAGNSSLPKSNFPVFNKLPLILLKMCGRILYRHIG